VQATTTTTPDGDRWRKMVKLCARGLFETPKQMEQMESRWSAHRGVGFARGPPPAFFILLLFSGK